MLSLANRWDQAMTNYIQFTKMHGIGNDFVVLDAISQSLKFDPALIRRIADRNFGIGCDQVLIIEPPSDPQVDFTYRIFNNDGKEVAQCGNGARCFGRFVYERGLTDKMLLTVGTLAGPLQIDISDLLAIRVNLGEPDFSPKAIPLNLKMLTKLSKPGRYRLKFHQQEKEVTMLSLGNPHCIIFTPSIYEVPVDEIGQTLQTHPAFLRGMNVSFVQVLAKNHIKCRVYERGAGETLACGSAACAAVIAGILQEELNYEVKVDMPGGALTVSWEPKTGVCLSGPTKTVFHGEFCLEKHETHEKVTTL